MKLCRHHSQPVREPPSCAKSSQSECRSSSMTHVVAGPKLLVPIASSWALKSRVFAGVSSSLCMLIEAVSTLPGTQVF